MLKKPKLINKYSITNKDPNEYHSRTLKNLIKNQNIGIIIDLIIIILVLIGWYLVTIHGFEILGSYIRYFQEKQESNRIGYYIFWITGLLVIINTFRELLFTQIIDETEKIYNKNYLTTKKKKGKNKRKSKIRAKKERKLTNIEEKTVKDEERRKDESLQDFLEDEKIKYSWGNIPFEKVYVKIMFYFFVGLIIVVSVFYHINFYSTFFNYNVSNGNLYPGSIRMIDYYVFWLLMLLCLLIEIFIEILNIIANFSRRSIVIKIILTRTEQDVYEDLQLVEPSKNVKQNILLDRKSSQLVQKSIKKIKSKASLSILNTPIDEIREKKMEELKIKKKIAYLKERKKLLKIIQEDKLKQLYGKGYRSFRKEQKLKDKEQNGIKEEKSDISTRKIALLKEKGMKKYIKNEVKEENKKEMEQNKEKIKKKYDFR